MEQAQTAGTSPAIDIQRFCAAKGESRSYMRAPWTDDGKTVATNGFVMIALDQVLEGAAPATTNMVGKVSELVAQTAAFTSKYPIDTASMPAIACPDCEGSGRMHEARCSECDGNGEFDHGSHTYSCKECDGNGALLFATTRDADTSAPCWPCKGSGFQSSRIVFGGHDAGFDANYLRLIATLPNVQFVPGGPRDMARFEFDGGLGFLMPLYR